MAKRMGRRTGKRTRLASKKSRHMMPGMDEMDMKDEMPMKRQGLMNGKGKKKRKRSRRR